MKIKALRVMGASKSHSTERSVLGLNYPRLHMLHEERYKQGHLEELPPFIRITKTEFQHCTQPSLPQCNIETYIENGQALVLQFYTTIDISLAILPFLLTLLKAWMSKFRSPQNGLINKHYIMSTKRVLAW